MKLVVIEWIDSVGCTHSWEPMDSSVPKAMVCRSVGWLLHDGEDFKVITPHIAIGENLGCGEMNIPTAVVRSIKHVDGHDIEKERDRED